MDWLLAPIDASRGHEVGLAVSWHARSMVLAWGALAPLAILVARFFKVLPGQDWPRELDSKVWWRSHWMGNGAVLALTILGIVLILRHATGGSLHGRLGYAMLVLVVFQVGLGLLRGTKGGPTAPATDGSWRGDHYDMTPWRIMFERVHKTAGYGLLALGALTILLGLWLANAPRWMWVAILGWWAMLGLAGLVLQRRGFAVDTYQAIWGPGLEHPGNQRETMGWRRQGQTEKKHVRSD